MSAKLYNDVESAVLDIKDASSIMVGGFGFAGNAEKLIAAVADRNVRELTLISNNAGSLGKGLAVWVNKGMLRRVICSYIGSNKDLHDAMAKGTIDVDVIPQGTLAERMRAGGSGIAAFYTPTGAGTVVAQNKETREFSGRAHILEHALRADYALIRARRADTYGNARFWRTARNFSPLMAMAASTTILEAETVVELGEMDPDDVHLPGVFTQRVVEVSEHEDPFEHRTTRKRHP